ncbi:Pentatricopeptide repeat - like 10 [Theobroma cacao]|nr:Pentatricopeptide repeat - like 10 [Theobroma cacao]
MIRKRPSDGSLNRNQRSSATFWSKCTNLRSLKQIHASLITKGFNSNPSALRELIFKAAVGMSGGLSYAHELFDRISHPDNFMWNTIIRGSAQSQNPLNAVLRYTQMVKCGVEPDNFTFPFVLKACTKLCWRKMGFGIQGKALKMGFIGNSFLRNTLIYFHANCGDLSVASELFDASAKRDVVPWSALTSGYAKRGELDVARRYFDEMPMVSRNFNVLLGNALVDMYAKCGSIERALEVFREMREKDVSTWNSVIGGLAFHGHAEESIKLFAEMQRSKVRPNEITFVGVFVACSHAGKVNEGHQYFKLMRDGYNIEPNIRHYGCMVDMLGRAGQLDEAFKLIDSMEIEPNAIIWRTLLGACRIHGNVELGRRANERLLKMRREQSGDYVLLSNIYASKGEWDGVEKVRKMMDDSGVTKEPGCSLLEAEEKALMHFLFDSKSKINLRPKNLVP